MTGYMFGKGIYFSDVVSKAANYCHASLGSAEGLLLLCEVALGNIFEVNKAKTFKAPPIYYHSVCYNIVLFELFFFVFLGKRNWKNENKRRGYGVDWR